MSNDAIRPMGRRYFLGGTAALSALTLSGCSTVPASGERAFTGFSSLEDDIRQGAAAYPQLIQAFGGRYDNRRMQSYVTDLGNRLAASSESPELPWEFTIVNTPITNAFALPGGKIAVTRGLMALAANEAELAGVVAHEIGHVTARHSARQQSRGLLAQLGLLAVGIGTGNAELMNSLNTVANGFLQSYSRTQEFEADSLGVRYIDRRGYDPEAMATFLASLREQSQLEARMKGLPPGQVDQFNYLSSHPRTVERVRQAIEQAGQLDGGDQVNRDSYLDAINGMLYGDDPSQGLIDGQTFTHPDLRFSFSVPYRFVLQNSPSAVVAQGPGGASIVLENAEIQQGQRLEGYLQTWLRGLRLQNLRRGRAANVEAVTGWGLARVQGGELFVRAAVFQLQTGLALRMLCTVDSRYANSFNAGFADSIDSLRMLSQSEADAIGPRRIIVARAVAGDTVESLARGLPYGAYNEDWFRLLNDVPQGRAVPGDRPLKIIAS